MCFTCVLIKEEAEGAGPQSHHQNGSAVIDPTDVCESRVCYNGRVEEYGRAAAEIFG